MLAAVGHESQETAATMQILAIFIQMSRKLLNASCQNGDLHLWGSRIGVMSLSFGDSLAFLRFVSIGEMISHSLHICNQIAP